MIFQISDKKVMQVSAKMIDWQHFKNSKIREFTGKRHLCVLQAFV